MGLLVALLLWAGAPPCAWAEPSASPAKKPESPTCNRGTFRIVVDVGHTAEVPGAKSARGLKEYDFNLRLATLIAHGLTEAGFDKTVLLITGGPKMKSLAQRVARANAAGADLFLSIHHDSVPDSFLEKWTFEGTEHGYSDRFKGHSIFISHDNGDSRGSLQFAKLLGQQLKARGLQYTPHYTQKLMGHWQHELVDAEAGVYRYDKLIVLKDTRMPAVLLEAGSIINREEELVMGSQERQSLVSAAVTDAVETYCVMRRPRVPEQIAGRPAATSKATFLPASILQPAKPAKPH
jgi:N-acetylmuramoyl-L-alanine amidase